MAALVLSARSHCGAPRRGQGMELDVIASVILGGCACSAGEIHSRHLLGSLIIARSTMGWSVWRSSSLQLVIGTPCSAAC